MSRAAYCHFIVNNKRRRDFFFFRVDEHRDYISGSHRWARRVNEPRFYANATRVNIIFLDRFCNGRRRRLTPATFLSISNGKPFSSRSGNQRFVTLHYPPRSDARRRFYTLRASFHGCVQTPPREKRGNEITAARSINYKKLQAVR